MLPSRQGCILFVNLEVHARGVMEVTRPKILTKQMVIANEGRLRTKVLVDAIVKFGLECIQHKTYFSYLISLGSLDN